MDSNFFKLCFYSLTSSRVLLVREAPPSFPFFFLAPPRKFDIIPIAVCVGVQIISMYLYMRTRGHRRQCECKRIGYNGQDGGWWDRLSAAVTMLRSL